MSAFLLHSLLAGYNRQWLRISRPRICLGYKMPEFARCDPDLDTMDLSEIGILAPTSDKMPPIVPSLTPVSRTCEVNTRAL